MHPTLGIFNSHSKSHGFSSVHLATVNWAHVVDLSYVYLDRTHLVRGDDCGGTFPILPAHIRNFPLGIKGTSERPERNGCTSTRYVPLRLLLKRRHEIR